jgi:integrase
MAVYKSKDPFRVKPWCADVYKGSTRVKRYFATEREAKDEEAKLTLSPVSKKGWNNTKVGHLLERYRDEITPTKAGYNRDNPGRDLETSRLNNILNNNKRHPNPAGKVLCGYSLSDLVEHVQAWEYVRARQKQVTMRTISRERNLLQDVFRIAKEEWGYVGLINIFKGLKLKGTKFKRTRRLEDGELAQLLTASTKCHGHNKYYVPAAIWITLETGMREQEAFNLQWRDIDFDKRTIKIRKSKGDSMHQSPGRTVVLPWNTMFILAELRFNRDKDAKPTDRIFPMTQSALSEAIDKTIERAGLEDFQYRDLRREANSRWDDLEPPLTKTQRKAMLGQLSSSDDINEVYSVSNLNKIRDKLDRQGYGKTFNEIFREQLTNKTITEFLKKWIDWGGTTTLYWLHRSRNPENNFVEHIANGSLLVDIPDERLYGTPKQTSSGEIYYSFDGKVE